MGNDTKQQMVTEGMTGQFGSAVEKAIFELARMDPVKCAEAMDAKFDGEAFSFPYFGMEAKVLFPSGECICDGEKSGGAHAVILLHYVLEAKPLAPSGRWISYRETPDSAAYHAAYQARGPALIAQIFGDDPEKFSKAAVALGGVRDKELPGLAYVIRALPRFPLALILYEGEPGLPAEAQILFDATAPMIFCAEDLAVLGEIAPIRLRKVLEK